MKTLFFALTFTLGNSFAATTYEVHAVQLLGIRPASVKVPSTFAVGGKEHKYELRFPARAVYSTSMVELAKPLVFDSEAQRDKALCALEAGDDRFQTKWQAPRMLLEVKNYDATPWDGHTLGGSNKKLVTYLEGSLVLGEKEIIGSKTITNIRTKQTARDEKGVAYYENLEQEIKCPAAK